MWIRLRLGVTGILGRRRFERELADEVSFHLSKRTEHWQREGLTPTEARRRARLEFGNVDKIKEEVRDARFGGWVEQARQDLRHGYRALANNRGFTAVAVLSLAIGIGFNTTIFSVVDAVLLRPMPYEAPDRLVAIERIFPDAGRWDITFRQHRSWRQQTDLFESMAFGWSWFEATVASEGYAPERERGFSVDTNLFATRASSRSLVAISCPRRDCPGRTMWSS